ncbi:MAG TPA: molecular chaperone HtpG [Clostridiales bacterium]|nr:molecular chaperone HtpG [Clostridiales bacterium]
MIQEKGNVSVNTENIFPIIRKWLYSDRDIFLRELVSNAADASSKLKRLGEIGEAELTADEPLSIRIVFDSGAGTLAVEDDGIGMTADEIRKYINQIAFSGVMDFVEKYKEKGAESGGIIGHFGLGFYSAFMVSDKVRIDTLSFQAGAEAASWESEDGMSYVLGPSDRAARGSRVTLTLSAEGKEFLTGAKIREILEKYCSFMPYPIYFQDLADDAQRAESAAKAAAEAAARKAEAAARKKESAGEAGKDQVSESEPDIEEEAPRAPAEPKPINDVSPLWLKNPRDCTDEEYKEFFRKTFHDYREPLFWIHLNMDYPFNLKGILYFPRTDNIYESLEGRIKIYYNQVFVADNIKEIIPEFLFLLKGCIDCPDLPLNVSRSFLQNDNYVSKLSTHIIRKVADKLTQLFQNQRPEYEKYWQDIGVFVKYGMLREEKFYDKVKDIALYKTVDNSYKVLADLGETLLYTTDPSQQVAYIQMAKARSLEVLVMDHELDNHFMSFIEYKNHGKHFKRVDAELGGSEGDAGRAEALAGLFRRATGKEKLEVKVQALGAESLPAMIQESEESRRMQEMRKQFERMNSGGDSKTDIDSLFPLQQTLIINQDQALVSRLQALADIPGQEEQADLLACQIYDLARLGHGSLAADDMASFLKRSARLLEKLAGPGSQN